MKTHQLLFPFILFFFFGIVFTTHSQDLSSKQIDSLVIKAMETFEVPGIAVAVIKNNEVWHKNTYGIQSVKTNKTVDENTLFGVASNTKAFTTAALAQLVDAGKMKWDDKVTDFIPEFKLYDSYVTAEFTVRDLVTHRSGLGLGAGDLMVFPASNTTTKEEMIHNLRYLKPVSSFRSKYDYDNLLYIVAGEIVARVSGESYDEYLANHFFKPLGMTRSELSIPKIKADNNRIDGHVPIEEGGYEITPYTFTQISTPAAGIYASINDMVTWVQTLLNEGKHGVQLQDSLFSKKALKEMWTPQTLVRSRPGPYNTHFTAYGLGWFLSDVNGYFQVTHTGGLLGIVSQVIIFPELKAAIIVLTNQQSGAAFTAISNSIKDGFFNIKNQDRIKEYNENRLRGEKREAEILTKIDQEIKNLKKSKIPKPDENNFIGKFTDPWFGNVIISKEKDQLRFTSEKSGDLKGKMSFYKGTTFIVEWDDRTLKADAFVNFDLDIDGKAQGFKMKAISPLTDFSYNYQDLDFSRAEN